MIFEFSIGPVQSFVAQARRTRDFWAGSYLLSWLTGVGINSVLRADQHAEAIFPSIQGGVADWVVKGAPENSREARIARLPNHARFRVTEGFDPDTVARDIHAAWRALAGLVWEADIEPIWTGADTTAIRSARSDVKRVFDRQVASWFEVAWTIAGTPQLAQRKAWRTHFRPNEPGRKCTVMNGLQELSACQWADDQRAFWQAVAEHTREPLRENERLSAIAWIKRRLAKHMGRLPPTTLPSGLVLAPSVLPTGVPSVAYLAVAPWLARCLVCRLERTCWHIFIGGGFPVLIICFWLAYVL